MQLTIVLLFTFASLASSFVIDFSTNGHPSYGRHYVDWMNSGEDFFDTFPRSPHRFHRHFSFGPSGNGKTESFAVYSDGNRVKIYDSKNGNYDSHADYQGTRNPEEEARRMEQERERQHQQSQHNHQYQARQHGVTTKTNEDGRGHEGHETRNRMQTSTDELRHQMEEMKSRIRQIAEEGKKRTREVASRHTDGEARQRETEAAEKQTNQEIEAETKRNMDYMQDWVRGVTDDARNQALHESYRNSPAAMSAMQVEAPGARQHKSYYMHTSHSSSSNNSN